MVSQGARSSSGEEELMTAVAGSSSAAGMIRGTGRAEELGTVDGCDTERIGGSEASSDGQRTRQRRQEMERRTASGWKLEADEASTG